MDNTLNQKTQSPTPVEKSTFSMINVMLAVVILGMGIYGFKNGNFDGISKKELEKNYVQKDKITFEFLNRVEKNNYVSKDTYLKEISKLENKQPEIIEKIVEKIVYKDKIVESDPRVIEKLIEKTVYKDRTIDKTKFDVFKCYGMSPSGYRMTSKCTSGLKKFLIKNKNAKYFEVIAVMNPKDFRTIMILEQKTDLLTELDLNKKQVSTLKELSTVGLDKLRVVETMWEVKKALGKQTIVVPVSYNVNSKKYRGTVLRAYN